MNASLPLPGSSCVSQKNLKTIMSAERGASDRQQRARTPDELRAWADTLLACELARCRSCMTAAQWAEHREWIEENARASLLDALYKCADRGEL
jgi:hypothetical protein